MSESNSFITYNDRILIAVIADEETTIGFLLAGVGDSSDPKVNFPNYFMVNKDTNVLDIESHFNKFFRQKNIGIIIIDEKTAASISRVIDDAVADKSFPIVIMIPARTFSNESNKSS